MILPHSINDLTGDIATCSATWLHVWSVNGDPLATVNTSVGSADRMQQILCCTFSTFREWDQQNVIITGSTDGVVRCWSIEYVQKPIENESNETLEINDNDNNDSSDNKSSFDDSVKNASVEKSKADLIKQISITQETALVKSGSESSISEACDNTKANSQPETAAAVERAESTEKDDTTKTIRKEILDVPITNMSKRGSLTSAKSLHELKREPMIDEPSANPDAVDKSDAKAADDAATGSSKGIRPSKSETSIIDSFVVVENEYTRRKNNANYLRDGKFPVIHSIYH